MKFINKNSFLNVLKNYQSISCGQSNVSKLLGYRNILKLIVKELNDKKSKSFFFFNFHMGSAALIPPIW